MVTIALAETTSAGPGSSPPPQPPPPPDDWTNRRRFETIVRSTFPTSAQAHAALVISFFCSLASLSPRRSLSSLS